MATLTIGSFVAAASAFVEPHSYDLCERHAERLTVPRGWEVVRLDLSYGAALTHTADDLEALADAVREAARPTAPEPGRGDPLGRRGHLRALPTPT